MGSDIISCGYVFMNEKMLLVVIRRNNELGIIAGVQLGCCIPFRCVGTWAVTFHRYTHLLTAGINDSRCHVRLLIVVVCMSSEIVYSIKY